MASTCLDQDRYRGGTDLTAVLSPDVAGRGIGNPSQDWQTLREAIALPVVMQRDQSVCFHATVAYYHPIIDEVLAFNRIVDDVIGL